MEGTNFSSRVEDRLLRLDGFSVLLWTELVLGFVVPLALFSIPDVRQSKWAIFATSCLVTGGVLLNRLNTAVFGMRVKHWETYFPSFGEFVTTFGVLAGIVLVYGFLMRQLPIHKEEPLDEPDPGPAPLGRVAESVS